MAEPIMAELASDPRRQARQECRTLMEGGDVREVFREKQEKSWCVGEFFGTTRSPASRAASGRMSEAHQLSGG